MELATLVSCTAARVGPDDVLTLEGEAVAALAPACTAVVARVGRRGGLFELLATLLAGRPRGVLVLGDAERRSTTAAWLDDGAIAGARADTPLGRADAFTAAFVARHGDAPPPVAALEPARVFVLETVVEAFDACDHAGATLLWLEGHATWLAEAVPASARVDASAVLLEAARRRDELGSLQRSVARRPAVLVPLSPPGERPSAAPTAVTDDDGDDGAWDFFDDPDPAALAEWADARHVFACCDGAADLDEVVARAMLGRFRALQAIATLLRCGHVVVTPLATDVGTSDTAATDTRATPGASDEAASAPQDDALRLAELLDDVLPRDV
ncbi:MAG: hypothetical protein K1X88_35920, partial [Nannocystaceae bacterium]|nr:hypothetical protein [Nannocystaceae bacterium]